MADPKTARRNLRVAPSDDALFVRAAETVGESWSEFVVESARTRAESVLADRTRFAVAEDDWLVFRASLDRPAELKPELARLMRRERPR